MSMGVTNSHLHGAANASEHIKLMKNLSLQQQIDHDEHLFEKT